MGISDTPQHIICAVYEYSWCYILEGYSSYNENDICLVDGKKQSTEDFNAESSWKVFSAQTDTVTFADGTAMTSN